MWARIFEFMLACWLAASPFILRYPPDEPFFWASDLTCAALAALFALLSFWRPLRKIHLLNLAVAGWLWGLGYIGFPDIAPPPQENSVAVGLFLLMLAVIPCHSHLPSPSWWKFYVDRS